ncbi:MAG: hypothetical protein WA777_05895 [Rhodanobacter sp.]
MRLFSCALPGVAVPVAAMLESVVYDTGLRAIGLRNDIDSASLDYTATFAVALINR